MLAKEQQNYTKYGVALFDATRTDKILKLQNMEAYFYVGWLVKYSTFNVIVCSNVASNAEITRTF